MALTLARSRRASSHCLSMLMAHVDETVLQSVLLLEISAAAAEELAAAAEPVSAAATTAGWRRARRGFP